MQQSQYLKESKFLRRASGRQRLAAAVIFILVFAFFTALFLGSTGKINLGVDCGFKERYCLPCPSCGMTTAALAFVKGKIFQSFYIQPAAALFCTVLLAVGFLSFLTAVFGIYFSFVDFFLRRQNIKYIILAILIIAAAAWAVTLSRALAARSQP